MAEKKSRAKQGLLQQWQNSMVIKKSCQDRHQPYDEGCAMPHRIAHKELLRVGYDSTGHLPMKARTSRRTKQSAQCPNLRTTNDDPTSCRAEGIRRCQSISRQFCFKKELKRFPALGLVVTSNLVLAAQDAFLTSKHLQPKPIAAIASRLFHPPSSCVCGPQGQLRASLEKSLGVAPGALDSQKAQARADFLRLHEQLFRCLCAST